MAGEAKMRVIRTALLATGFALAGLAACQTRHKPIVQVNYDDFTATEFTDCKQTSRDGNSLIVCDSHSDWLNADGQPAEPTPVYEYGMMLDPDVVQDQSANEIYGIPEPTPSPTPTPAADLGDTGCDAAHAGRRNIDMEGSEWRCLWVLADKNSPAKQYRWAQVAASPLPSPSPMPDKDGVPLTCKGDGKADALGFDMSVRCSHGIVVFADNSSPPASPTPTPEWSREHCPPDVILESGRAMSLSSETTSNPNYATYCGYGMGPH